MDADEQEFMEGLVESGCLVLEGLDAESEPVYRWNWDLLSVLHPEFHRLLWEEHLAEIDQITSSLTDRGYLTMGVRETEDGGIQETFQVTEQGREAVE